MSGSESAAARCRFSKYHALGNDYIVIDAREEPQPPGDELVRRICDRHRGVGADGVLWGPTTSREPYGLRLFNPDGGEFEKSGNGLRIFARYLWDRKIPKSGNFTIGTPAGSVTAHLLDGEGNRIAMDMGCLTFDSRKIHLRVTPREAPNLELRIGDLKLTGVAAAIGNPHCVVFLDGANAAALESRGVDRETACRLGPAIEHLPVFPARTNVQFARVTGPHEMQIEIWERGAGYTLASGTSSCAAAGAAVRTGRCTAPVTVRMPGGEMLVEIDRDWAVRLTGTVEPICDGELRLRLQG